MGVVKRRVGGAWVNAVTQKRASGAWAAATAIVRASGAWQTSIALPTPWVDADIGAPPVAGSATYAAGTFTVKGAGSDIWDTFDQFHLAYQSLPGDGSIIARVTSQTNTNPWAKTGIMIKQSATAGAPYALLAITPANGVAFQTGFTTTVTGPALTLPNVWFKMVRAGSTITGYTSPDGTTWTQVGTANMSGSAVIGLFVCSHNATTLCTSTFDNVSVSPLTITSLSPNSGSVGGSVTISGAGFVPGATVSFGGTPATNVVVVNGNQITCTTPAHANGPVTVTVTTGTATSNGVAFTYGPGAAQPPAGDNTAFLQSLLDAVPVNGTLDLGPYIYRHNNVVFIRRDGMTVNANGAVFQATAESTSAVKIYANNVTVNGLKLTCPVTTQRWTAEEQHKLVVHGSGHRLTDIAIDGSAGAGLYMWQCSNYTVTRPNIKNTRADTLHQTGGCNNGFVDHPTVQNGGDDGVAVVSYGGEPMCHDITIESPTVIGTTWGRGISVVGGQNITYRNIDVRDTDAAGVYIACEPSYTTLGVTTVKVLGGTITRCNKNAQVVHGGVMIYSGRTGLTISDVVIDGVTIVNTPPSAQRNMAINQSGGGLSGVVFSNIAVQQSGSLPVLQSNSARSAWTASGITVNGTPVTL